jgi:predicted DNA-binding transcriptional regulator AlpA
MPKTSSSERPAFASKAAKVKAAKATTNIALDLIEANQEFAAKSRARAEHDDRSVRAARVPPAWSGTHLLSKREVLGIVGVSYPTLWTMMRANTFPRSRKVGGQSKWLSTGVAAWLAALPRTQLKGDAPSEALRDEKPSEVTPAPGMK